MAEPFSYRTLLSEDFDLQEWDIFTPWSLRMVTRAAQIKDLQSIFPELRREESVSGFFDEAKQRVLVKRGFVERSAYLDAGLMTWERHQRVADHWWPDAFHIRLRDNLQHWMTQHCVALYDILDPWQSRHFRHRVAFEKALGEVEAAQDLIRHEMPEALERYQKLYLQAFCRLSAAE